MADDRDRITLILARTADAAGPFEPPPIKTLLPTPRSGSRATPMLSVAAAGLVVVAVAIGLTLAGHRDHGARPPVVKPVGHGVPVSALRHYRWSAVPAAPIALGALPASAWTGRLLIVWGGDDLHESLVSDGATYDPATRHWEVLPRSPLVARWQTASAWTAGRFVIWGGTDKVGHALDDGASYDPDSRVWTKLPAAPIRAYRYAQLVAVGNQMILITTEGANVIHADVLDPRAGTWRRLPDLTFPVHHDSYRLTALTAGRTVYVWSNWSHTVPAARGGTFTTEGIDTYALRTGTGRWSPAAVSTGNGRTVQNPIWTGRLIVSPTVSFECLSCNGPLEPNHSGIVIDPHSASRRTIPPDPVETASGVRVDAWTGSVLLTSVDGRAAAWDPKTGRWTRLAAAGSRLADQLTGAGESAIWAGTSLFVTSAGRYLQFAPS